MHIKSLEITGFKSFVDRTMIHFDHDMIGVIGPNGCGKSNIVDAIRWCMGEQSAKHLRGRLMEDVIFNGSESRGPMNLAEVTVTFDNSNVEYAKTLPEEYADYPEIAVTRRLFRDGTSGYLINKTPVRLRDITELFLGTGVGSKAYSIVEQGRIGQIVTARPEQRRLFIEEAAGVTKYRQRKKQAERKMELTRQNLLRISDIVSEKERNRNSLKRQVAKAERYLRYREELDELMLHDSSHRLLEMIVLERVESKAFEAASARAKQARTTAADYESTLDEARAEASRIEARSEQASLRAAQTQNDVTVRQTEINHSKEKLGTLRDRMTTADAERQEISQKLTGLDSELQELDAQSRELGSDEDARIADADAEDAALAALAEDQQKAEGEVQGLRQQVADLSTHAATAEARLTALADRVNDARSRRDRLATERDSLGGELANLDARRHALETSVAELAEGKALTDAEREALHVEIERLRARMLESERAVDGAKNELGLKRNRLEALEDLHRRLDGVNAGVRALLSSSDDAIVGLVADRVEAPEELTYALAGLLGDRLQCVIVSDPGRGIELLDGLRKSGRGRATITPARPRYVAGAHRDALPDLAEGFLADLVQYRPEDEGLIRSLIGDAVVTTTSADALEIVEKNPGVTAVALDGTVARPDGLVSGGSGDDVASAMVEHKREMHALGDEVVELETRLADLVSEHTTVRARMTEVGTALDRAREGAHEGELAQVTVDKDLARSNSDIERARQRRQATEVEAADLERMLARLLEDETTSRADLDDLRLRLEQVQQTLAKAEENAASWKERVAAQAKLVTERKVRLAQVKEQADAARGAAERLRANIQELRDRSGRLGDDVREAAEAFGRTAGELVVAAEAKTLGIAAQKDAQRESEEAHALLEQVRNSLGVKEAELRELRDELETLDADARTHEMKLQELGIERRHLIEGVREKFRGLDLRRVVGDYHRRPAPDEEHRRRITELTRLIDRMGPTNLDAQREFEEEDKAYQELSAQQKDVEEALTNIEKSIRYMNRESRRMFREAFTAVNELFKHTFQRLFRGGRAELALTDPEDVLESGVEIVAQPPGKKLGNIELMSGGEKALTAAALIFAIFRHRPSPFCVLDEVDAPLDEANVGRYVEMIREMTDHSQFILITHVKRTMQSVDALYGVTMHEPGISQLVSVKVSDEAGTRSERRSDVMTRKRPATATTSTADETGKTSGDSQVA